MLVFRHTLLGLEIIICDENVDDDDDGGGDDDDDDADDDDVDDHNNGKHDDDLSQRCRLLCSVCCSKLQRHRSSKHRSRLVPATKRFNTSAAITTTIVELDYTPPATAASMLDCT